MNKKGTLQRTSKHCAAVCQLVKVGQRWLGLRGVWIKDAAVHLVSKKKKYIAFAFRRGRGGG